MATSHVFLFNPYSPANIVSYLDYVCYCDSLMLINALTLALDPWSRFIVTLGKGDPFDLDMWIDLTCFQCLCAYFICKNTFGVKKCGQVK